MVRMIKKYKYSCLFFAEGKKDKNFLYALIELDKFKYHTANWNISTDNASGASPRDILGQCLKVTRGVSYDLIVCFIDLDKLKSDYRKTWQREKIILEAEFSSFKIIWQEDNAEDEYRRVIGGERAGKHIVNKLAKENIEKFINSKYWKRVIECVAGRERELTEDS